MTEPNIDKLITSRNKLTSRRYVNIPALNEIDAQLAAVPAFCTEVAQS